MATKSLNNPFADFGGIVHGDRFIGRKECIDKIAERVLGTTYGNLAIMGLPRVGKSSLAWRAIMDRKEELVSIKTIPIFFEAGSCTDSCEFFKKMVTLLYDELEFVCEDTKYQKFSEKILNLLRHEYDKESVQKFFKLVKKIGYKTIYILDEFDSVQSFFDKSDFQFLRELSYNPETHLCLVTCSRKTIEDIEVKDGAISNFAGTCSDLRLGMFSKEDVALYWGHFNQYWEVDDNYKDAISYFTGNHPWLMDKINSKMFSTDISTDLLSKFEDVKLELMEILDNIVSTIEKEKLLDSAIQVVVGPYYNANQKQIEKLLKYDFIKIVSLEYKEFLFSGIKVGPTWDKYCYTCFSDYSTLDFYRRYYANVPYVSLWSDTENLLRYAVKEFLNINFSEDWENKLANFLITNPPFPTFSIDKWKNNLNSLKNNRNKMIQNFPTMHSGHLVDFTLTAQIFDLFIRPNWKWFNTHIFKGSREEWNTKFEFLTILRNPVAHNNVIGNIEEDMRIAREYCQDVSVSIQEWQKNRIKNNATQEPL